MPSCGSLSKPKGRNYTCDCGYVQHRDMVGAMNILRVNSGCHVKYYKQLKYLQIG